MTGGRGHQVEAGNPCRLCSTPRSFAARCASRSLKPAAASTFLSGSDSCQSRSASRASRTVSALSVFVGVVGPEDRAGSIVGDLDKRHPARDDRAAGLGGRACREATNSSNAMALHGREPCEVRLLLGDETHAVVGIAVLVTRTTERAAFQKAIRPRGPACSDRGGGAASRLDAPQDVRGRRGEREVHDRPSRATGGATRPSRAVRRRLSSSRSSTGSHGRCSTSRH